MSHCLFISHSNPDPAVPPLSARLFTLAAVSFARFLPKLLPLLLTFAAEAPSPDVLRLMMDLLHEYFPKPHQQQQQQGRAGQPAQQQPLADERLISELFSTVSERGRVKQRQRGLQSSDAPSPTLLARSRTEPIATAHIVFPRRLCACSTR
jgi:hypothetical protein